MAHAGVARQLDLERLALRAQDVLAAVDGGDDRLLDLVVHGWPRERHRHAESFPEPVIPAAVVEQRLAGAERGAFHAAHEDRVIAFDVGGHGQAFELGQAPLDEGQPEVALRKRTPSNLSRRVEAKRRERASWSACQEVDGEPAALAQGG